MAYQTSTSITSAAQLLDVLASFLSSNGWTVERNTLSGATRTVTLRKTGVTDYIHLYNDGGSIGMCGSTGYDAGQPATDQPGGTVDLTYANVQAGPFPKVWFFANGNEVHVTVRRSDITGAYCHFAFGCLTKYGSYVGGTYFDGSYFNTENTGSGEWNGSDHGLFGYGSQFCGSVRVDHDGYTDRWLKLYGGFDQQERKAMTQVGPLDVTNEYTLDQNYPTFELGRLVGAADDNAFSARSVLHTIEVAVRRAGTPVYYSPVGYIDNTRYISLAKFSPEEEITIGSDTWVVFPVARKAEPNPANDAPIGTGVFGYAVRKVT